MTHKSQIASKLAKVEGVPDFFGLLVYGRQTPLYTNKVAFRNQCITLFLCFQLLLDSWAWYNAWSCGLAGWVWPLALALIFAGGILMYDRDVLVSDPGESSGFRYTTRAAVVLLLALVTSVPVELAVFKPDIDRIIDDNEKIAVDAIRAAAKTEEETKHDKIIAEAKERLTKSGAAALQAAEADLSRYEAEYQKQRQELQDHIDSKRREAHLESAGGGVSRRYGRGPAVLELESLAGNYARDLKELDEKAKVQIEALTKARDEVAEGNASSLTASLDKLNAEKERAILATKTMEPEKLAKQYGGQYLQSRGFLSRYKILEHITSVRYSAEWCLLWGCRVVMVVFGLLILGMKIWSPEESCMYYSLSDQAAAGHPEAVVIQRISSRASQLTTDHRLSQPRPAPRP